MEADRLEATDAAKICRLTRNNPGLTAIKAAATAAQPKRTRAQPVRDFSATAATITSNSRPGRIRGAYMKYVKYMNSYLH